MSLLGARCLEMVDFIVALCSLFDVNKQLTHAI